MKITKCDRCGAEIKEHKTYTNPLQAIADALNSAVTSEVKYIVTRKYSDSDNEQLDFCETCYNKFKQWLGVTDKARSTKTNKYYIIKDPMEAFNNDQKL